MWRDIWKDIYMYIHIYWNVIQVTLGVRRFSVGRGGRGEENQKIRKKDYTKNNMYDLNTF